MNLAFLLFSKFFERMFYYGIRALLIIYLTDEIINMEDSQALQIYGYMSVGITIFTVIGALAGDFLLGHKRTMLVGLFLQLLGALLLLVKITWVIYLAVGLIAIGSGFYFGNLLALLVREYLNKPPLIKSAFLIYFIVINMGAFLSAFGIGYLGDINFAYGFGAAILCLGCALIFAYFIKAKDFKPIISIQKFNYKAIGFAVFIVVLMNLIYEAIHTGCSFYTPQFSAEDNFNFVIVYIIEYLCLMFLALLIWRSSFPKLNIAFSAALLGAGSLFVLSFLPTLIPDHEFLVYLLAQTFFSITEILILVVAFSYIALNVNLKYLATSFAVIIVVFEMIARLANKLLELDQMDQNDALNFGWISLGFLAMIILLSLWKQNQLTQKS